MKKNALVVGMLWAMAWGVSNSACERVWSASDAIPALRPVPPVDALTARLVRSMVIDDIRAGRVVVAADPAPKSLRTVMLTDAGERRVIETERLNRVVPDAIRCTYERLLSVVKKSLMTSDFSRVEEILKAEPLLVYQCDATGGTLLHMAARYDAGQLATIVLNAVKQAAAIPHEAVRNFLDLRMGDGQTALHAAAFRGCPRLEVITILLDAVSWAAGDEVKNQRAAVSEYLYKRTTGGLTALHVAIFSESFKTIEALLRAVALTAGSNREAQIMAACAYLRAMHSERRWPMSARDMLEAKGWRVGDGFKISA
jgi:hypothetical protein